VATLQGSAELSAVLRSLPDQVEKKALRSSALAGAQVVAAQVKQFAPVGAFIKRTGRGLVPPGTLRRAVRTKYAPEKSGKEKASYVVTLRRGKGEQKKNRDAYYWIWVEKGHRVVGRSKRVIGQAPPHPFFVPAYRASQGKALQAMQTKLGDQVTLILNQAKG
jgi:HK97 gp10 family phage protein